MGPSTGGGFTGGGPSRGGGRGRGASTGTSRKTFIEWKDSVLTKPGVATLREGDPLPRGWQAALFTVSTTQTGLRPDGVGGLGFHIPPSDLPRMVLGGRRTRFLGDIRIGSRLRRESRTASIVDKQGRAGPMRICTVLHRIFAEGDAPVLEEEQDYIQLEEEKQPRAHPAPVPQPVAARGGANGTTIIFDEAMLFRYSAITFNAHRIHYDKDYAREVEGYPGLLVNGGLSALFLLETLKTAAGGSVSSYTTRNLAPLFCGVAVSARVRRDGSEWHGTLETAAGQRVLEATATFQDNPV